MNPASDAVREFFERYERSRNSLDADLIGSQYPDALTMADPSGARVVEKQAILATVPKGRELLEALGHQSTRVVSLDESRLDDHYALVRVVFVWRFERPPAQPVDVEIRSTFILHLGDDSPRIVFQHEHQEFLQALRARGLL